MTNYIYQNFIEGSMPARTMPVCFTKEQLKELERYAKARGMLNLSQAVEHIIKNRASK